MNYKSQLIASAVLLSMLSSISSAAIIESGDAGALPSNAYFTGSGVITGILGALSPGHDIDLFAIDIPVPAAFSAKTVRPATVPPDVDPVDTQLFLFDSAGVGVVANDDGPFPFFSEIPSGFVTAPGRYYLAIAEFPDKPVGASGLIFPFDPGTVLPLSTDSITGWLIDPGPLSGGDYEIVLTGAQGVPSVEPVPEPSTLASFSLLLLLAFYRLGNRGRRCKASSA